MMIMMMMIPLVTTPKRNVKRQLDVQFNVK